MVTVTVIKPYKDKEKSLLFYPGEVHEVTKDRADSLVKAGVKKSKLTLFKSKIKRLDKAQVVALEKTAEALHTEVVQAQVVPRETGALQNEALDLNIVVDGKKLKDVIVAKINEQTKHTGVCEIIM